MTSLLGLLAVEVNVAQQVAFWILAVIIVGAAFKVVTTDRVVRAALYLVLVLGGVGALYMLAAAEFVATTQFMAYIGAIVVLFLFGIMLTKAPLGPMPEVADERRLGGAAVGLLLALVMGYALIDGFSDEEMGPEGELVLLNGITDELPDSIDLTDVDNRFELSEAIAEADLTDEELDLVERLPLTNTQLVADSIFSTYIVPFEAISVLLLAALIGAIVLARKE